MVISNYIKIIAYLIIALFSELNAQEDSISLSENSEIWCMITSDVKVVDIESYNSLIENYIEFHIKNGEFQLYNITLDTITNSGVIKSPSKETFVIVAKDSLDGELKFNYKRTPKFLLITNLEDSSKIDSVVLATGHKLRLNENILQQTKSTEQELSWNRFHYTLLELNRIDVSLLDKLTSIWKREVELLGSAIEKK